MAPTGAPLHVNATAPVNAVGDAVTVYVAVWPAFTVAEVLADDNAKSEPAPVRLTFCVVCAALSVIVSVAVRLPAPAGVKLIGILQFALAARL